MNNPLVTAVITSYKRDPSIVERALKSIISQTYSNIEIFVVDDSPANYDLRQDVKNMVESYSAYNVKYIAHEVNQGACAARNTGLALASGEFIGFLDDDDEWLPNKIEEQLKPFADSRIGLVYCPHIVVNDVSNQESIHTPIIAADNFYSTLLEQGNYVGSNSFPLVRTKALIECGGFDPIMPASQDYDAWIRIAQNWDFSFIDLPLIRYHVHAGDQITKSYDKRITGTLFIIEKNKHFFAENPKSITRLTLFLIALYIGKNEPANAFKYWWKSIWLNPLNAKENFINLGRIIKCMLGFYKKK